MVNLDAAVAVYQAGPFWLAGGSRLTIVALLLIPWLTTVLVLCSSLAGGKFGMQSTVQLTTALKVALRVQAAYFIFAHLPLELLGEEFVMFESGIKVPRVNAIWELTNICSDALFSFGVFYLLLSLQDAAPRWVLYVPIVQCAYNVKNDLVWYPLGAMISPESKPSFPLGLLDGLTIVPLICVYVHHFLTAAATAPAVKATKHS